MRLSGHVLRLAFALVIGAVTVNCGGGGDSPTPPAPATAATVELSTNTVDLAPNGTLQLTATARSSSGTVLTGRTFSWAVVSTAVATVSGSGLVTGVADGTTTVTVTADGKSAAATVTVRTPVASVVVTPTTAPITIGGTAVQFTAAVRDAGDRVLNGRSVAWSSSNVAVATVTQTGLVTGVAAGPATITATSEGRSGTATVAVSAPDPCLTLRTITVGQTLSGTLAASDCRLTDNTVLQNYTFTVATETVLEIEMTSAAVDPYLFVLDAVGNVVAEDDDGGPGINARVIRSFPAGKYLVIANAYDPNSYGNYQLALRPAPAACTTNRALAFPGSVNATLAVATACRLNDDSYLDRYEFSLLARTTVRLDMVSSAVDSYLYLIDNTGKFIAQDDDAGTGVNSRIEVQLDAGKYVVFASALNGQTGNYRLDVVTAVDPCAVTRTLTLGQSVNGTLSANDCAVASQGPTPYTQRYALNVTTAAPLQIDMTSSNVDAYLIIQSATTGAVLAENDDVVQGNTNSRIAANFAPGQYIVNATSFNFNEVGTYVLSVAPIAPVTPVGISLQLTTLALNSGQEQQLTPTVTGTANTAVTWTTTSTAVATVTGGGLVRGVTPGTATITVRSLADPSKTASVAVTVTQSQSGTANLDIGAMYLIQSVQQLDGSVQLVANRDAVARVYLRGSRSGIGSAVVRLSVFQGGTLLQTFQANVTPTVTIDEGCCSANITIPGTYIRTGASVLVEADPGNLIAESNENDNKFPLNGVAQNLNVVTVPDFNIRLVPIRQNRSGQTGASSATVLNTLKSLWPLNNVNVSTRGALAIDYALVSTSFDEWGYLVRDLELTRRAEGVTSYYYGLVRVAYTSGVLGLAGGIPALSAVGVDEGSSFGPLEAKFTLAHEVGHTIGLRHAPCGGAAGPDPAFPFADGRAGAYGLDIASGNVVKVPSGTDIMGYCDNQWVSVYNYRNVFDLRQRNPNGQAATLVASGSTSVLMISGSVNTDAAIIDGAFALNASPNKNDPSGRFVLEGFSSSGKLLFSHRFSPFTVSDGRPGDEGFVIGVPVDETVKAAVARVTVREVSGKRANSRTRSIATASSAPGNTIISAVRGNAGALRLQWANSVNPMVMLRDPATGEILGIGRTGQLDLSQFTNHNEVELFVSDGVMSVKHSLNTRTGAIRQ